MFYVNDIQTQCPQDWQSLLGEPDLHWKPGFSAWALAHCWEAARGFPTEILALLSPCFPNIQMIKAAVEHKVPMPGIGRASQNDLFVYAQASDEDLRIAIEGKVSEKLGPTIKEWHSGSANKDVRLLGILNLIDLPRNIPDSIRYQLLHRMASPVVEAKASGAKHAIMIVHSFSDLDESFDDFSAFLGLYGISKIQAGILYPLKTVNNLTLYAGWARGDLRFLSEQAD